MNAWIGLGSNQGDRRENLEKAAGLLIERARPASYQAAPILRSPALMPAGAPADWNIPFLNSALLLDWNGTAPDLLALLKQIELDLGRQPSPRWSPRPIDLDLLALGDQVFKNESLQLPHPEMANRQFVLSPLKYFAATRKIAGLGKTVLQLARARPDALPLWMGIVNVTPDSFSEKNPAPLAQDKLKLFDEFGVHIVDLGAESTRPGAIPLSPQQEWNRLAPLMDWWIGRTRTRIFKPILSVDTYHPETAARAIAMGAGMVNDVSGLADAKMLEVLADSRAQYVLMHSLSVPADPKRTLQAEDPVNEVLSWARTQLARLQEHGISLDRVIFDPGIGFGKTAAQSWALVRSIERFYELPVRLLAGHSRKSFIQYLHAGEAADRDAETLGLSLNLATRGVDILRVHDPLTQQRAFHAFQEGTV